ncbi:MAG: hypothetical protein LBS59_03950 [Puniceicoccales bacterium]|jgi:hypothetical protein|nr:hypothetical protein [Puniceicoccales bacterium]
MPLPLAKKAAILVLLLLFAGTILSPIGGTAERWQKENQPAFNAATLEDAVGQGALLGIFGGFRAIMADFAWLRAYLHWENHDRAACETLMRLSIALDPGNLFFWRNTADIIAYDMPHWEIATRRHGGRIDLDPAVIKQISQKYAQRGLDLYANAVRIFPRQEGALWVQCALICQFRLNDPRLTADYYRKSAECPTPVWFAPIAYVNILTKELGQKNEAAAWLRSHIKKIRSGQYPAQSSAALDRLETKLRDIEK